MHHFLHGGGCASVRNQSPVSPRLSQFQGSGYTAGTKMALMHAPRGGGGFPGLRTWVSSAAPGTTAGRGFFLSAIHSLELESTPGPLLQISLSTSSTPDLVSTFACNPLGAHAMQHVDSWLELDATSAASTGLRRWLQLQASISSSVSFSLVQSSNNSTHATSNC
jgi:hypothetical protein